MLKKAVLERPVDVLFLSYFYEDPFLLSLKLGHAHQTALRIAFPPPGPMNGRLEIALG